jgi:hypothetical protein
MLNQLSKPGGGKWVALPSQEEAVGSERCLFSQASVSFKDSIFHIHFLIKSEADNINIMII